MTDALKYCEEVLKKKHLEYKADHIPCTVQSTYFSPDKKHDTLMRRELMTNGQVIFGIEYDTNGNPAEVYTTDSEGKRIKIATESMDNENQNLPNLISERLEIAKSKTKTKTKENSTLKKDKKASIQTKAPLHHENAHSL